MKNSIEGKYKIDRTDASVLKVITGDDTIEINTSELYGMNACFITRIEKLDETNGSMSNKIVQYTDLNGTASEIIIEPDKLDPKSPINTSDLKFDTDYLYMEILPSPEHPIYEPVYVELTNIIKDKEK